MRGNRADGLWERLAGLAGVVIRGFAPATTASAAVSPRPVWAWAHNTNGQAGDNSTAISPTLMATFRDALAAVAESRHLGGALARDVVSARLLVAAEGPVPRILLAPRYRACGVGGVGSARLQWCVVQVRELRMSGVPVIGHDSGNGELCGVGSPGTEGCR